MVGGGGDSFCSGMATDKSLLSDNSTSDPIPKPHPNLFSTELRLLHHARVLFSASFFLSTDSRSVQNLNYYLETLTTVDNKIKGRVHCVANECRR